MITDQSRERDKSADITKNSRSRKSEMSELSTLKTTILNDKSSNNLTIGSISSPGKKISNSRLESSFQKKSKSTVSSPDRRVKRRRVVFNKNFVEIVNVESYKKYNVDISEMNNDQHEKVTCKCMIY
jgi:hypothetical protein